MSERAHLTKAVVYSVLAKGSSGLMLLLMILMGRWLGETALGQFTFALSFVSVFAVLMDAGTETVFLRDVAAQRDRAPQLLGTIVVWKAVLGVATIGVIAATARGLGISGAKLLLVDLLAVSLVLSGLKSVAVSLCQAFESFGRSALLALIERAALVVAAATVLVMGGGLPGVAVVFVVVRLLDLLGTYGWVHRRLVPFRVRWDWRITWALQRAALPLALALILGQMHDELEVLCLGWLRSDAEVGRYAAVLRIMEMTAVLPAIVYTVLLPRLSALSNQREAHGRLSGAAMRVILFISLPIALGIGAFAGPLIRVVFGEGFVQAASSLRLVAAALPLAFLNSVLDAVLLSRRRQGAYLTAALGSLAVGLAACLLWIPRWGAVGAALANLLAEAANTGLGLWLVFRAQGREPIGEGRAARGEMLAGGSITPRPGTVSQEVG